MAKIKQEVRTKLINAYGKTNHITNAVLNMFEQKSPELVRMLNAYQGTFAIHQKSQAASYTRANKLIAISADYTTHDFYLALAHELGHATGTNQSKDFIQTEINTGVPTTYKTALAYSDSLTRGEGEAIYHEYLVAKELNILVDFNLLYDKQVLSILNNNKIGNQSKFTQIGVENRKMHPGGQSGSPNYTYDEKNIALYMYTFTDINQDYKEVMNHDLIPVVLNGDGDYVMDLHHHSSNIHRIKSLTNRSNGFFAHGKQDSDSTNDTFTNGIGLKSAAQQNDEFDVMYGGKGVDKITGADGKEIILGGDGIDTLKGNGGDDILGGNTGHDHLYGGTGSDTLKGGSGFDKYHFELADISHFGDTDTIHDVGTKTIIDDVFDDHNRGEIIIAGVSLHKAKWVNKGNGVFQAADQKWQLKLIGTDWEITGMNGSSLKSKIIVKDAALTATAFGLTLPKAASASSRSVSANEHAFLASSISAANNLISAMSAFGVDNVGMADDLNARSAQYHAPLLAASAI